MPLAKFIRIEGATAAARQRANCCALLTASQTTNSSAAERRSGYSKFVTVLFPKTAMTSDAPACSCLRGRSRCRVRRYNRGYWFNREADYQ